MTKKDTLQNVTESQILHIEKAYRRGYLHGALRRDADESLDLDKIERWRNFEDVEFQP